MNVPCTAEVAVRRTHRGWWHKRKGTEGHLLEIMALLHCSNGWNKGALTVQRILPGCALTNASTDHQPHNNGYSLGLIKQRQRVCVESGVKWTEDLGG